MIQRQRQTIYVVHDVILFVHILQEMDRTVADPGFSKWGGAVLSQMGGAHPVFR